MPCRQQLAGSERCRQGRQRDLAQSKHSRMANEPFRRQFSPGRHKSPSAAHNTSDVVCPEAFPAPHSHWGVRWQWGGAAPAGSSAGRRSLGRRLCWGAQGEQKCWNTSRWHRMGLGAWSKILLYLFLSQTPLKTGVGEFRASQVSVEQRLVKDSC